MILAIIHIIVLAAKRMYQKHQSIVEFVIGFIKKIIKKFVFSYMKKIIDAFKILIIIVNELIIVLDEIIIC